MPSLLSVALSVVLLAPAAFAAGHDLGPRPLGPSAYAQQTPLVAYAGGKYLTVWLENLERAGWRYLGALSDRNGGRLSPSAFVVVPQGLAGPGTLLGTGDSFALFFPLDEGVQMFDIDLAGQVTGSRIIPIENARYDPAVAWNGTHFVAIENTRAVFFDRTGAIARKVTLPCRPRRHELVTVRTDVIVASTCDDGGLRADFLTNDGSILTTTLDPSFTGPGVRVAAAAAANNATLIVWGDEEDEQLLKAAVVSVSGRVSPPRTVAHGGTVPYVPLALAAGSNESLLPYMTHGALHVAILDDRGGPIALNESMAGSFGFPGAAATDGRDILVADIHYESQLSRGGVRTRLVGAGGEMTRTGVLSIVPARQLAPAIAAGSGSLVAAWTEKQGTTSIVRAARIAPDGTPLGSSVIDLSAVLASDDLAWNGAEYLTVIHRNDQLRAQRINAFGQRVGGGTLLHTAAGGRVTPRVAVVWAGDHWEVVGTDTAAVFRAVVAPDGKRTSWQQLKLEGILPEGHSRTGIYDVAAAYDGERVLVAWVEGQSYPCNVLCPENRPAFVAAIDRAGLQAGPPRRISDAYANAQSLSLATNGDEVVAIASSYQALVTSFDAALEPAASRTFDGSGDVTWDGSAFVLALRERDRLTVRRLDARLRDGARARVAAIAPTDSEDTAPSIAVAISGNGIVALQECDANSGGRAVAYVEQELGYEAQRRRTVRR